MNLPAITRSLLSTLVIFLGLNISGGGNHGIAVAQTWQNVPSKSGSSGTWQALSCNTTSNQTWQPLGCNPVTYTCPAGYTLSGQTCSMTVLSSAIPNYYCSSGVLSGSNCVTSSSYAATPNYYCPSGGSLSGTTCTTSTVGAPTYASSNPCLYGGGFTAGGPLGNGFCREFRGLLPPKTTLNAAGWFVGACQAFGAYPGGVCQVYNANKSCPVGYTLSGSSCYTTSTYTASINSYSCPTGGALSGASCAITNSSAATISSYYCNSGVLIGSQCSTTVTVPATAN